MEWLLISKFKTLHQVRRNDFFNFSSSSGCCNIDVWGIILNILLQDAPFLAFRLLIIIHYNIISYMNVFFTCKNTLVILLQIYRLYVVNTEHNKTKKRKHAKHRQIHDFELSTISIVSKPQHDIQKYRKSRRAIEDIHQPKYKKHNQVEYNKR